jgi:hypothetical protein
VLADVVPLTAADASDDVVLADVVPLTTADAAATDDVVMEDAVDDVVDMLVAAADDFEVNAVYFELFSQYFCLFLN